MKDLTYSELVETLRSSNEPVIVVIDELYQNKKKVAASLAADAGISPVFPRLQFNPSAEKLEMRRESLRKIGGKPVMFINDYPKQKCSCKPLVWKLAFQVRSQNVT